MTASHANPDSANAGDTLRQNIEDHIACTQALLQTLAREHAALLGGEAEALEQTSAEKNRAVANLQQLSQRLGAAAGAGPELERRILRGDDALLRRWQTLMELAAQCQQANLANGALLDAKHAQVKWALGHMLGAVTAARTYGPAGLGRDSDVRRIFARA